MVVPSDSNSESSTSGCEHGKNRSGASSLGGGTDFGSERLQHGRVRANRKQRHRDEAGARAVRGSTRRAPRRRITAHTLGRQRKRWAEHPSRAIRDPSRVCSRAERTSSAARGCRATRGERARSRNGPSGLRRLGRCAAGRAGRPRGGDATSIRSSHTAARCARVWRSPQLGSGASSSVSA